MNLTDPAHITGSVVAWAILGYVVVFLLALALAGWLRRLDRRGARVRIVTRSDRLENAMQASEHRCDKPRE